MTTTCRGQAILELGSEIALIIIVMCQVAYQQLELKEIRRR